MPRTSVIDFVEEKKLVEQIIMTNWNPLACEPVKFKTYLAEPTTLLLLVAIKSFYSMIFIYKVSFLDKINSILAISGYFDV